MRNWKTTSAGVAALLAIVAKIMGGGTLDAQDYGTIAVGIGLLTAKDHNVTGPA